jgi:hypothetical protein
MIDAALGMGRVTMHDLRATLGRLFDTQFRLWAGMAFMTMALASIQYDEIIAPGVGRISHAWTSATSDLGRTLASFTL